MSSKDPNDDRGIIQRSFEYIFGCIEKEESLNSSQNSQKTIKYLVKASYLEIYNEQIMDMLNPSP